jgi:hypothetical protein
MSSRVAPPELDAKWTRRVTSLGRRSLVDGRGRSEPRQPTARRPEQGLAATITSFTPVRCELLR